MSADPTIHELLIQLDRELKHTDTISERDQELFKHLIAHLQELIDKPESSPEPLSAKLEGAIAEMDTTHPSLITIMERVISGLSNMGI